MVYSENAVLFEPNWNPIRMTELMNTGDLEIPQYYWELLEVLHRVLTLLLMKHHEKQSNVSVFVLLIFFWNQLGKEICLSFFQTDTKAHGFVGGASTGYCSWCPRCSGYSRSGTRDRASFSTKRSFEINPWGGHEAHVLLHLPTIVLNSWCPPPLLWPPLPVVTVTTVRILFIFSVPLYLFNQTGLSRLWK